MRGAWPPSAMCAHGPMLGLASTPSFKAVREWKGYPSSVPRAERRQRLPSPRAPVRGGRAPCDKTCGLNGVRCARDLMIVGPYATQVHFKYTSLESRAYVRYICSKWLLKHSRTETRKRVPDQATVTARRWPRRAMAIPATRFAIRRPAAPSSRRSQLLALRS